MCVHVFVCAAGIVYALHLLLSFHIGTVIVQGYRKKTVMGKFIGGRSLRGCQLSCWAGCVCVCVRSCVGLARTVYIHRMWPYIW